ncbi:hypothetical protein PoB_006710400 [Plakobranchus ocellatus]|uniref:Uncharacterized protein n=1 Tax=Plakobranchus ocellatus TaxID=259542 RepID=A0AAV4D8Q1_9GAST|nr:hypothetical protein PoB_006710400 [Plakobranchus ocellatus]
MDWFGFCDIASRQQDDRKLSGPPPGKGAHGGARTRDRRVPADIKADSIKTMKIARRITEQIRNFLIETVNYYLTNHEFPY